MASWDDVQSAHRHIQQTVRVPMRADLLDEIGRLEQQAAREAAIDKTENRDPVAVQIANKIREVEAELVASEVEFTFRAVGRRQKAELEAAHPPTDAQKAEAGDETTLLWNGDTFPPALLAASCIAPDGFTLEAAQDVWDNWSEGQVRPLWQACLAANIGRADAGPKSQIASEILNESALS